MTGKNLFKRALRILKYHHWVFGSCGRNNFFSKGDILYENCSAGHDNYFSPYVMINNARIGNYCSFGPGSKIGLGEHSIDLVSTYPRMGDGKGKMQLFDLSNPTVIGHDVWIGANAVIRQGVMVGNGAVIGAGSVVTKDVEPYSVVAGIPARKIRDRFSDEKKKMIMQSNWYEKDFEEARSIVQDLMKGLKE